MNHVFSLTVYVTINDPTFLPVVKEETHGFRRSMDENCKSGILADQPFIVSAYSKFRTKVITKT